MPCNSRRHHARSQRFASKRHGGSSTRRIEIANPLLRQPSNRGRAASTSGFCQTWEIYSSFLWGNLALKGLVEKMVKAGLSPKTVNTYSQVVKAVVASAVNEEGEPVYPRKWNHELIDMPVVQRSKQNTPHFTGEVVTGIIKSSKGYKQMFLALLAGTGLRAGEAMGIEIDKHISADLRLSTFGKRSVEQRWKTFSRRMPDEERLTSVPFWQPCSRGLWGSALQAFSSTTV